MDFPLTDKEKIALAFAYALSKPAISPEFKHLPILMGTAGEMENGEEVEKWFYKIPYNREDNE